MNMKYFKPAHFNWRCEGDVAVITLKGSERKNPITFEFMPSCAILSADSPIQTTSRPSSSVRMAEISAREAMCAISLGRC